MRHFLVSANSLVGASMDFAGDVRWQRLISEELFKVNIDDVGALGYRIVPSVTHLFLRRCQSLLLDER